METSMTGTNSSLAERELKLPRRFSEQIALAAKHWPDLPQTREMPKRFPSTIADFCDGESNQDRRGLRVEARKAAKRTLKHIKSAERTVADTASPESLPGSASSLLKSLKHNTDFDRTIEQARQFAGDVRETGKRRTNAAAVWNRSAECRSEGAARSILCEAGLRR